MVRMVRMVRMFYEVRLSRTCFLISRRRSKPQCGSINVCNPFARSAGIFRPFARPSCTCSLISLISRRRSKPQCGSINLCNPFARSVVKFIF